MSGKTAPAPKKQKVPCEICILAGGLSSRMGRDKARLRFGGKTLLGHARALARETRLPVRVIRRDLVARCGPLGGIYTALKTTHADAIVFLACDMPFVSSEFLEKMLGRFGRRTEALFTHEKNAAGFPFVLRRSMLEVVSAQLAGKSFSLQALAEKSRAKMLRPSAAQKKQFLNLNTPADWELARRLSREKP